MLPADERVSKPDVPIVYFEDLFIKADWKLKSERNWSSGFNLTLTSRSGQEIKIPSNQMEEKDLLPEPLPPVENPFAPPPAIGMGRQPPSPPARTEPEDKATYKFDFVLEALLQADIMPSKDLVRLFNFPSPDELAKPVTFDELRAIVFPLGYQLRVGETHDDQGRVPVEAVAIIEGVVPYTFYSRFMDQVNSPSFDPAMVLPFFAATNSTPPADFAREHPMAVPPEFRRVTVDAPAAVDPPPVRAEPIQGGPNNDNNAPPAIAGQDDPFAPAREAQEEQRVRDEERRQREEQQREELREQQAREEEQRRQEANRRVR